MAQKMNRKGSTSESEGCLLSPMGQKPLEEATRVVNAERSCLPEIYERHSNSTTSQEDTQLPVWGLLSRAESPTSFLARWPGQRRTRIHVKEMDAD
jgi:hypothetical protein